MAHVRIDSPQLNLFYPKENVCALNGMTPARFHQASLVSLLLYSAVGCSGSESDPDLGQSGDGDENSPPTSLGSGGGSPSSGGMFAGDGDLTASGGDGSGGGAQASGGSVATGGSSGTGGSSAPGGTTVCDIADEGDQATLSCPPGQVMTAIEFASYGTPVGACGSLSEGACAAEDSISLVVALCVGQASCSIDADNATFGGDPCSGTPKQLAVEATCEDETVVGSGGTGSGGAMNTGGMGSGGDLGSGGSTNIDGCPFELVGWAATGSGTTGGGDLTPIVVTSASELRSNLSGDEPRVVHLSGTVDTGSDSISIASNKTLRGVDANARIVGGLSVRGSNVIVQNLTVQGKGQGNSPADAINSSGASNLWFDHLNVLDGGDGILDLTNASDRATVSWCKFWYTDPSHDHRLALLFGNSSEKCEDDGGKMNHTVHHNWFAELVDQRMPRLLFGKGHVFNNYYNSPGNGYCVGAGSWGSVLVENNYFKDVNSPHKHQDGHPNFIAATGNVYDNTSGSHDEGFAYNGENLSACESALEMPGPWTPSYPYTLDAAESVPELVMRCAGPQ